MSNKNLYRYLWLGLMTYASCLGCNSKPATVPPEVAKTLASASQSRRATRDRRMPVLRPLNPGMKNWRRHSQPLEWRFRATRKRELFRTIVCSNIEVTDELASLLSTASECRNLTLTQSAMSDSGWAHLQGLSGLQQFDVRDCQLSNQQLENAVRGMPELRALRLSGRSGATTVDDAGLAVLAGCPKLKVLAIDELWIGTAGLQHLAKCDQLAELYMKASLVDDESMSIVAGMKNLRKLRLAKTSVGTAGLQQIRNLPLEVLDISECSYVLDDSMAAVGAMRTLKQLNLWRDVVSDAGLEQLAGLVSLEWLNLDNTHITDAGLHNLQGLRQLKFLHLGSTAVSDAGMPELVGLQALRDLKVTRTSVTEAGVALVETSHSRCGRTARVH